MFCSSTLSLDYDKVGIESQSAQPVAGPMKFHASALQLSIAGEDILPHYRYDGIKGHKCHQGYPASLGSLLQGQGWATIPYGQCGGLEEGVRAFLF